MSTSALEKAFELAKLYITRPTWVRFVVSLIGLAGSIIFFGFQGDWSLGIKGAISGINVDLFYRNTPQLWVSLALGAPLVGVAVWLFIRSISPPIPRSERLEELEDAYRLRGKADSVCQKFREVHAVYVSPDELADLMDKPETSRRAISLRKARSHVEYRTGRGLQLKNPRYPYKLFSWLFTCLYFTSSLLVALPLFMFLVATAAAGIWPLFWQYFFGLVLAIVVAWSSLAAFSACDSSLSLTEPN